MQETWVQSLGWEDPLEEGMATHFSILPWRIPMDRGAWQATVHRVAKSQARLSAELAQTHVHRVSDAIQPSHPLLSPSPPAFNLEGNLEVRKLELSCHCC